MTILRDLKIKFEKVDANRKNIADDFNKICSMYLYENQDKAYKNEDVFFLLRFAVSGNTVGPAVGEICEIIG